MAAAAEAFATRVRSIPFSAIAAFSFVFIVPLAAVLNIWQDEAYTLHTTAGTLAASFRQALTFEQNAPLYFVLLTGWRHANDSIFFLRLFSILCMAGALVSVPALARRYVPRIDAPMLVAAIAWNPFFFWAALEIRVYAMIVLVSSLLLLTFYDAFLARERKRSSAILYALCTAVALYTQYYMAFLIAAQFVLLLLYRRSSLRAYILCVAAAGALFAPLLADIPGQVQSFRSAFTPPESLLYSCRVLASILAHYVLPLPISPPTRYAYAVIAAALLILAVVKRRSFTNNGDGLMPVLTVTGALLFATVTYFGATQVFNRHAAAFYIPAVLGGFALLTFLRPELRARAATAWFLLAFLSSSAVLLQNYRQLAKPGDWHRVVAALRAKEEPAQPIVVFEAENALPFAYYYHGPNRVVALPNGVNFRNYDVREFVVRDEGQMRQTMPHSKRLWLITAGECASANVEFGCDVVERYVAAHYRTDYDQSFYQARLRLLSSP